MRRVAITTMACALTTLLPSAPASAKGLRVTSSTKPGAVPVAAQADAWFRVGEGSRCHLVGRRGRQHVSGRIVRTHRPLLQYHWKVPIRARAGTWRLTLTCSSRRGTGSAMTKLEVQGGATRRGVGAFQPWHAAHPGRPDDERFRARSRRVAAVCDGASSTARSG